MDKQIVYNNTMVIVLDKHKKPLGFVTEKRAKQFLNNKRAVIHRLVPFIIRLKDVSLTECKSFAYTLKIDPGSKYTGMAILDTKNRVVFRMQINHRADVIVSKLESRKANRRSRRNRKTRYRRCKFRKGQATNSARDEDYLPPSIQSILANILTMVNRLRKWVNITGITYEHVKFDTQLLDNPEISGITYQQGTLYGYELKAYLLEKYGHTCQYCGNATKDFRLEWEHMRPKSRGGSDSVKNATLACHTCNQEKSDRTVEEYLSFLKGARQTELVKAKIDRVTCIAEGHATVPKNYAAWVNSMRWQLYTKLKETGLALQLSSGGRTAKNRSEFHIAKTHCNDAACVGKMDSAPTDKTTTVYIATAMGHGTRLKGRPNSCGILSKGNIHRAKTCKGFQTGDYTKLSLRRVRNKALILVV